MGLYSGQMRRLETKLTLVPAITVCEGGGEGEGGGVGRMLTSCPRCQATFPCSPGPSPSAPLSFVLPSGGGAGSASSNLLPQPPPQPETDLQRLKAAVARLRLSGWYFEGLTWRESVQLLSSSAPGTFLVRDSSHPRFLFSLSVQTVKGPTSIRIHYVNGTFRMDADPTLLSAMPTFDCVVQLVEYYVARSNSAETQGKVHVWVDRDGQMYSDIVLIKPLYRRDVFPSLQHLARLAINALPALQLDSTTLPVTLTDYLKQYPYTH